MSAKRKIGDIFNEQKPEPEKVATTGDKGKQTLFRMSSHARKQLDHLCVEVDQSLQALLTEAVNDMFTKHGKPPIA